MSMRRRDHFRGLLLGLFAFCTTSAVAVACSGFSGTEDAPVFSEASTLPDVEPPDGGSRRFCADVEAGTLCTDFDTEVVSFGFAVNVASDAGPSGIAKIAATDSLGVVSAPFAAEFAISKEPVVANNQSVFSSLKTTWINGATHATIRGVLTIGDSPPNGQATLPLVFNGTRPNGTFFRIVVQFEEKLGERSLAGCRIVDWNASTYECTGGDIKKNVPQPFVFTVEADPDAGAAHATFTLTSDTGSEISAEAELAGGSLSKIDSLHFGVESGFARSVGGTWRIAYDNILIAPKP